MGYRVITAILCACVIGSAQAEETLLETRIYRTDRVNGEPPMIDGAIDDAVWESVEWSGDFIQREPAEGEAPSRQTEFKVLYDDDALYFAFRIHDDPEQVTSQLARRDWFPGDWIEVNIDSYFDRRTAFSFTLSLSGTRGDEFISNDGNNWNTNWDPIWNGATQIVPEGWTAEMRIPLSQLRFDGAAEQVWGIQVTRRLFRLEERSSWQRIPKNLNGWVSRFGELHGLRDLRPKRRIELSPYVVASGESFEAEAGNPFRTGSDSGNELGLDGKVGLTNNLTLDFTINPDFGQVEADPSEVNLTAFETFFDERRPFFIEGNDIFDLRLAPAQTGGSFARDRLFYSRRIGRRPAYRPDVANGFVDAPENTTILGAFKLSGKTASGLSIGLLESVTAEEKARILDGGNIEDGNILEDGNLSRQAVEPLTSYFVGRLQQDFDDGETQIGGMITAVNRQIDDEELDFLVREAYAGGLDFSTYFRQRDYRLEANLFGSELRGSREAILEAQTSPARYYQRPDNDAATLDPNRTALSGHAGSVRFTRTNNHELMYQSGFTWRSPGFEINDLGFMRDSNRINQFTWVGYHKRNPFSIFNSFRLNGNQWLDWDFGGNFLCASFNVNANAEFRNRYQAGAAVSRLGEMRSNVRLRGGPASRWPGAWSYEIWGSTDRRKDLFFEASTSLREGDEDNETARHLRLSMIYRPTNAIQMSITPNVSTERQELQYIDTLSFDGEERYVFGSLDHETLSLTLRLDYSITPNLTVQLYASPFLSNGRYTELKRILAPRAREYRDRFSTFTPAQLAFDPAADLFEIDENADGAVDYSFSNPDFDAREYNSNLVIRWEYSPGSAAFFVWSQVRDNGTVVGGDLDYDQDLDRLFSAPAHNVVLVKVSKWFSL